MDILAYVVILVALVALSTPLWAWLISKSESEDCSDRLEKAIGYIRDGNAYALEELHLIVLQRRMLIQYTFLEGHVRLV